MENLDDILGVLDTLSGPKLLDVDTIMNSKWEEMKSKMTFPQTYNIDGTIKDAEKSVEDKLNEYLGNMKEQWITNNKALFKAKINSINKSFNDLKDVVIQLPIIISSTATQLSLPTCIGTVVPNPARIVLDLLNAAEVFKNNINDIKTKVVDLVNKCVDLGAAPAGLAALIINIQGLQDQLDSTMGGPIAEAQAEQAKQEAIEEKLRRPIPGETLDESTTTGTEQTLQIKKMI